MAQTEASISGVIRDPSGAVIPGATVTVTNPETNLVRTAISNEAGVYNFPILQPGKYNIKVELPGSGVPLLAMNASPWGPARSEHLGRERTGPPDWLAGTGCWTSQPPPGGERCGRGSAPTLRAGPPRRPLARGSGRCVSWCSGVPPMEWARAEWPHRGA